MFGGLKKLLGMDDGQGQQQVALSNSMRRAPIQKREFKPMLPQKQMANKMFEDGSGFVNGTAFGAGDSAGDMRPQPMADHRILGIPSYDSFPEQYAAPQAQGYGEESYFNTPIQGMQNHGNVDMQGGYGRSVQEPSYQNFQQDPTSQFRRIRFN